MRRKTAWALREKNWDTIYNRFPERMPKIPSVSWGVVTKIGF